jgi:hypothetical protein
LEFKNLITERFNSLFGEGAEGDEYSASSQFNKKWGWYNSLYALARGDVQEFERVGKLRLSQCLQWLTYESDRIKTEKSMIKK